MLRFRPSLGRGLVIGGLGGSRAAVAALCAIKGIGVGAPRASASLELRAPPVLASARRFACDAPTAAATSPAAAAPPPASLREEGVAKILALLSERSQKIKSTPPSDADLRSLAELLLRNAAVKFAAWAPYVGNWDGKALPQEVAAAEQQPSVVLLVAVNSDTAATDTFVALCFCDLKDRDLWAFTVGLRALQLQPLPDLWAFARARNRAKDMVGSSARGALLASESHSNIVKTRVLVPPRVDIDPFSTLNLLCDQLLVVTGESGSGKTTAVLHHAVENSTDVAIYCIPGDSNWETDTEAAMDQVANDIEKKSIRNERAMAFFRSLISQATGAGLRLCQTTGKLQPNQLLASTANVRIIFDEMGSKPLLLRALCAVAGTLTEEIASALNLSNPAISRARDGSSNKSSVKLVAVGTGTDGTTTAIGSLATAFEVRVMKSPAPEPTLRAMFRASDELQRDTLDALEKAIFHSGTAAAYTAQMLLGNARCATMLAQEAYAHHKLAQGAVVRVKSAESLLPAWVATVALRFKGSNGLQKLPDAGAQSAGLGALGVASWPFWVRTTFHRDGEATHGSDRADDPMTGAAALNELGVRLGMITDNARWHSPAQAKHELTQPVDITEVTKLTQPNDEVRLYVSERAPRYSVTGAQVALYQMRYGQLAPRADSATFESVAADHAAMCAALSWVSRDCFVRDPSSPTGFRVRGMDVEPKSEGHTVSVPAVLGDATSQRRITLTEAERAHWERRAALHVPDAKAVAFLGRIPIRVTGHHKQPEFLAGAATFVKELAAKNKSARKLAARLAAFVDLQVLLEATEREKQFIGGTESVAVQHLRTACLTTMGSIFDFDDAADQHGVAGSAHTDPPEPGRVVGALINKEFEVGSSLNRSIRARWAAVHVEWATSFESKRELVQSTLVDLRRRVVELGECLVMLNGRDAAFGDLIMMALGKMMVEQLKLREGAKVTRQQAREVFAVLGAVYKGRFPRDTTRRGTTQADDDDDDAIAANVGQRSGSLGAERARRERVAMRAMTIAAGRLVVEVLKLCCATLEADSGLGVRTNVDEVTVARFFTATQPGNPNYHFGGGNDTCFVLDVGAPNSASDSAHWLLDPLPPWSIESVRRERDASADVLTPAWTLSKETILARAPGKPTN